MAKILLVEDDEELAAQLQRSFRDEGYLVEWASNGEDAIQLVQHFLFEIILLDWDLPGMPGLDVCRFYRRRGGKANIILLTGHNTVFDKETALDSGADDYLTKPFSLQELFARVRSTLRRPRSLALDDLRCGRILLDVNSQTISNGVSSERCTRSEVELLAFLIRNKGRVYSSQELTKVLSSEDHEITAETVRSLMRNLRARLGTIDCAALVQTVSKAGYVIPLDD